MKLRIPTKLSLHFLGDKHKQLMLLMLFLMLLIPLSSMAGADTDFDSVKARIGAWLEGSLGMTLSLGSLGVGLARTLSNPSMGVVLQTIGICLAASMGVPLIATFFTAAL